MNAPVYYDLRHSTGRRGSVSCSDVASLEDEGPALRALPGRDASPSAGYDEVWPYPASRTCHRQQLTSRAAVAVAHQHPAAVLGPDRPSQSAL